MSDKFLTQMVPEIREIEVTQLLQSLAKAPTFKPFSPERMNLCRRFSDALFADKESRLYPELQALAYFMRASTLRKMEEEFRLLQRENSLIVPRGMAFHLAPANVDTVFIYSWLISTLVGNKNIVRISRKQTPQTAVICRVFNECIEPSDQADDGSADTAATRIITYDHDDEINASLSAYCDVRVIWGGDDTVRAIRRIPLPPHAKEIVFPDRHSLAAIAIEPFLSLSDADVTALVNKFYNDIFWFDQMACSSPRYLIWCGTSEENFEVARRRFTDALLSKVAESRYKLEVGASLFKLTAAYRAILDEPVDSYIRHNNELTTMVMHSAPHLVSHPGFGTLYQMRYEDLQQLAEVVSPKDQTLAYYGFSKAELFNLAQRVNGRGIDRIVPIGESLSFQRFWDGYDLLYELAKTVQID